MKNIKNPSTDRLFKAILNLKTVEECYDFFEDVCTIKELSDMTQRLDTAFLLYDGMSYQKITENVNVSTATIGRVSKCLNYGSGGYKLAIDRIKSEEN
ncbi:MAG: TrpR-related protein YerC/YecD [Clostridia bacterium]|nr:TrpR-related protein YerC/YecD [Oscillospiraceae bacterium]MBR6693628.1 TrpR-related protein YerC/YecD [Clostridia bacterium]